MTSTHPTDRFGAFGEGSWIAFPSSVKYWVNFTFSIL